MNVFVLSLVISTVDRENGSFTRGAVECQRVTRTGGNKPRFDLRRRWWLEVIMACLRLTVVHIHRKNHRQIFHGLRMNCCFCPSRSLRCDHLASSFNLLFPPNESKHFQQHVLHMRMLIVIWVLCRFQQSEEALGGPFHQRALCSVFSVSVPVNMTLQCLVNEYTFTHAARVHICCTH